MRKSAFGGNGGANKGNSNIGGWNRGLTKETDDRVKNNGAVISKKRKGKKFTKEHRRNLSLALGGDGILDKPKPPSKNPPSPRYIWTVKDINGSIYITKNLDKFSADHGIGRDTLRMSYIKNKPISRGIKKGWQAIHRVSR